MATVYVYWFPNGKGYVGKTVKSVGVRLQEHVWDAERGTRTVLNNAVLKYGIENIVVEILACRISESLALDLEVTAIAAMGTEYPHGYNMTKGGDGIVDSTGRIGQKRSLTMTGRLLRPDVRARIAAKNRLPERRLRSGRVFLELSQEIKDKISAGNRSPERRAAIAAVLRSPEVRAKMSASQQARQQRERNARLEKLLIEDDCIE